MIWQALKIWFFAHFSVTVDDMKPIQPPPIAQNEPVAVPAVVSSIDTLIPDWSLPANAKHNVRVLCDLSGLSYTDKNIVTACVQQESQFYNYLPNGNPVKHENLSATGALESTDWGICQVNDYFHIGPGKDFPSVEYVMANPQVMVQWMIDCTKAGKLSMWSSYSTGAYKKWLPMAAS